MAFFGRTLTFIIALVAVLVLPTIGMTDKLDDRLTLSAAHAQFASSQGGQNTNTSSVQNASANNLLLRGLIGGMLSTQDPNVTSSNVEVIQGDYAVAGRWRMFVNESIVQRFVANFTVAKTDGSEYHNILIENIGRNSEFVGSTSEITAHVYADSTLPSTIITITIELEDKVLRITDIDIGERTATDRQQIDLVQIIDGQSIYGIVEFQEIS